MAPARVAEVVQREDNGYALLWLERPGGLSGELASICTPVPPPSTEPAARFWAVGQWAVASGQVALDISVAGVPAIIIAAWVQSWAPWAPPTPADHAAEAIASIRHWLSAPVRWWREREARRARLHAGAVNRALVSGSLGVATSGLPVDED